LLRALPGAGPFDAKETSIVRVDAKA